MSNNLQKTLKEDKNQSFTKTKVSKDNGEEKEEKKLRLPARFNAYSISITIEF